MNREQYTRLKAELSAICDTLEEKFSPTDPITSKYNTPVNFKESLATPIHRWYGYKEGFSPNFVKNFISKYSPIQHPNVFDPFGGIGTTVLVASQLNLKAASIDVNPLGNFVANVKCENYLDKDIISINQQIEILRTHNEYPINLDINNATVRSYFDNKTLDSLLRIKSYINSIINVIVRNLFRVALLSLISDISTHRKDGNGVKRKRKAPLPLDFIQLRELLIDKVHNFVKDITEVRLSTRPNIIQGSCIEPYELPFKVDVVITSPPYANCFDYSKVYLTELWVGGFFETKEDQKSFRENSVSSHVHYQWKRVDREFSSSIIDDFVAPLLKENKLWNKSIPTMLQEYFADMGRCLYYISKHLNPNAVVGFVVGNSVYSGIVIPTDLILSTLAERIGFTIQQIITYRKLSASSQQMSKMSSSDKKFLRESLVLLKWK